jgi:hypothetical protein
MHVGAYFTVTIYFLSSLYSITVYPQFSCLPFTYSPPPPPFTSSFFRFIASPLLRAVQPPLPLSTPLSKTLRRKKVKLLNCQ